MNVSTQCTVADRFFEFSLLGLLASGFLAVAGSGYLDAPTTLLTALGLIGRAVLAGRQVQLAIPGRAVTWVTAAYLAFYPADYFYISRDFLVATIHLLFFLATVKILIARTDRDFLYLRLIAFLELLAASVLSSNANFFLFLAAFLVFGAANLAAGEIRNSAARAASIVRAGRGRFGLRLVGLTLFTVSGILALTAALFLFLPRTARAARERLIAQKHHLPGFSSEVALGQIGELKLRSHTVMHIRILNRLQPPELKWRGAALTDFDGKRWFNSALAGQILRVENGVLRLAGVEEQLRPGRRIAYEVVMHESAGGALFFAGSPELIQISAPVLIRTPSQSYRVGFSPPDRLRYIAYSLLEVAGDPRFDGKPLDASIRLANLQLPKLDPRIAELARAWTAGLPSDLERARRIESYLRTRYAYTSELPQQEADDPIADFLLIRRKGHCEYFASAMAVMLRTIGIPARVVTGFQSGIFNPISGWRLIRASDAHSWVEAWLAGQGWTTFDPTPPNAAPPALSVIDRWRLYVDAVEVFWQDWVLSYDLERQMTLATRMGQSTRNLHSTWFERPAAWLSSWARGFLHAARDQAEWVALAVSGLMLLWVLIPWLWRRWLSAERMRRVQRGEASASDATLLYLRMLASMRRHGLEKPAWLTPSEFARLVPNKEAAALVSEFTAVYHGLRFGGRKQEAPKLVALLEQVEKLPPLRR